MALAPYACSDSLSRGRVYAEPSPQYRDAFMRDRDRIVHCGAFRRLEYKTQVFINHEGDMYRTRLTHSLEVAQIGRTVCRILALNEDLIEAITLAHDLGHTPFGHAGQDALNACMQDYGGFEHNLQSLRVVDTLEERYADFPGLNLTFETREGILKHCNLEKAAALGELGERFLTGRQASLEGQVANLVDAIAYNNHDVDDGLRAGLLTPTQLSEVELFADAWEEVRHRYPDLAERRAIHEVTRRIINRQVVDLVEQTRRNLIAAMPSSPDEVRALNQPLVAFSAEMQAQHHSLKQFLRTNLYRHYRVHRMTSKAKRVLHELFDLFFEDPQLMPNQYQERCRDQEARNGRAGKARVVADYIAGMTDRYAFSEYHKLFTPPAMP